MKLVVTVKPNAKHERLVVEEDGSLMAFITEPPVEGKTNKALIQALARHFDVAPSRIRIVRGHKSRKKFIEII